MLDKETKVKVQKSCNVGLVPDDNYSPSDEYPIEWFERYFSFLNDAQIEKRLGEAFYQARFSYKLMNVLGLPVAKHKALVNMQIIQYASICEAVLQKCIEDFLKEAFQQRYAITQFVNYPNALSVDTHIMSGTTRLYVCKEKIFKADLKRERMDHKTSFAIEHGIISEDSKEKFDKLYDMRNNVHILKATQSNYNPRKYEAENAFLLMQQLVTEIKAYYQRMRATE